MKLYLIYCNVNRLVITNIDDYILHLQSHSSK